MNEVSIIINGIRYDAVMNDSRNDCIDCAFFESCKENDTCCNFLGDMEDMHFEKSDKNLNHDSNSIKTNANRS